MKKWQLNGGGLNTNAVWSRRGFYIRTDDWTDPNSILDVLWGPEEEGWCWWETPLQLTNDEPKFAARRIIEWYNSLRPPDDDKSNNKTIWHHFGGGFNGL